MKEIATRSMNKTARQNLIQASRLNQHESFDDLCTSAAASCTGWGDPVLQQQLQAGQPLPPMLLHWEHHDADPDEPFGGSAPEDADEAELEELVSAEERAAREERRAWYERAMAQKLARARRMKDQAAELLAFAAGVQQ